MRRDLSPGWPAAFRSTDVRAGRCHASEARSTAAPHLAANTDTPPLTNPFAAQPGHPAGDVAEEYGTKMSPVAGSIATECALLPVLRRATTLRLPASTIVNTGVHGDAAEQAPFVDALPEDVHRLAAL